MTESESVALPLGDTAISYSSQNKRYYSRTIFNCQEVFGKKSKKFALTVCPAKNDLCTVWVLASYNAIKTISEFAMTLENMPTDSHGIVLAAPTHPCLPPLPAGTHVKIIRSCKDLTVIDAEGLCLTLSATLAAKIIVIKQIT